MKKLLVFLFAIAFSMLSNAQEAKRKITGKIAAADGPLKGVNIRIKNTSNGVLTNAKGKYKIDTFIGDVLVFSYIGFHTIEVTVDQNNVYNLDMYPAVEELDEVVVKKKKIKAFSQKELLAEFPTNKNLIKTSRGILDKERASFSMRMVDGSEILPIGRDFLVSLQAHFPNMLVDRDSSGGPYVYFQRIGQKWSPALFDVDGFIYAQAPTWINPSEIDRIAVIKRNGAFARYGPAGSGGVIIINTKEKTRVDDLGVERKYNNANLRDSLVGKVNAERRYTIVVPDYIMEYKNAKSANKATEIFNKEKKKHENSAAYFLDVAKYFRNKWYSEEKAQEILEELQYKFSANPSALKALAYRYEELGQKEKALVVYLKILKIESKNAQSHRDVANAYAEIGNYKEALSKYARYKFAIKNLDALAYDEYGQDLLLTTEVRNIIVLKGQELSLDRNTYEQDRIRSQTVRLLFEWNHPNTNFKLRIVSPDDYYDDWETPPAKSAERKKGYYSTQFFLDEAFEGEWRIITNYNGNEEKTPSFLKVTVFFDYDTKSQLKQTKVFKLSEKESYTKLLSIFTEEKYIKP